MRSSSPNDARQTAPGASRVAITTRACSGSDGRNVRRSQPSSRRSRSAWSIEQDDRPVGLQPAPDGGEEALRRRLDLAAVDGHDVRAARGRLGAERAQQRGLARAGDAVDDHHGRRVVEQRGELLVAADHRRAPLGEQRSEGAAHGQADADRLGSGATTVVATTGLIASVGSISASACSSRCSGLVAS